jgi:hypothetical protein
MKRIALHPHTLALVTDPVAGGAPKKDIVAIAVGAAV